MTSRIAVITIDAVEPDAVVRFWCAVLGWEVLGSEPDITSIGPADGPGPTIDIARVPEAKAVKNRLHLDLRADGTTQSEELRRLLALGARRVDVGQASGSSWVVLSDPEGNELCLLSRSVQDVAATPEP